MAERPAIEILPVAPETVTVLGYRVKPADPMWTGLDLDRAELRTQSTLMAVMVGPKAAPYDLHLNVPWIHPDDVANGMAWEDDECWYRVRPRMEPGQKWHRKMVANVAIRRDDSHAPPWVIEVTYA